MSRATKTQIEYIRKIATLLDIEVNTKGLTSQEASQLYRELLLLSARGDENVKIIKRKR